MAQPTTLEIQIIVYRTWFDPPMSFSQRGELGVQLLNNAFNGNCSRREATSNLAGLLGTVAIAKDPGNLPGSLFKPPEVDELALLDRFSAFVPRGWKR